MVKGLYTAYTGMINEQRRLDILSNNLANSNTVGYKKEGATSTAFADQLAIKIKDSSNAYLSRGIGIVNLGTKIGEVYTNFDQGAFRITDRPADMAISGNGFFAIEFTDKQGNSSIRYTRNGEFTVNNEGYFMTPDGDYLLNKQAALNGQMGEAAHLRVDPAQPYTINEQGFVFQNGQIVGQVGVVDIDNYDFISKYGENLYDLLPGGNVIDTNSGVEQGCLEASNVSIVDELVNMITIQRAYEAGQKMIQTEDETIEMAVNQVGRV